MKALTLHQPWATCVSHYGKPVENRTWAPPRSLIGQRFAIHAGKRLDREAYEELAEFEGIPLAPAKDLPRGAVVCTAVLWGWVHCDAFFITPCTPFRSAGVTREVALAVLASRWWVGPYGWVLGDVRPCHPVACLGAQGLWTLPASVEEQLVTWPAEVGR